jgi:hypothetical protein
MRVSEAVHLRDANMDSQRMMIRIELSKGTRIAMSSCPPNYWNCCAAIGAK